MSIKQFPGGIVTKNPTAPSQGIASGIWTLDQAMQFKKQGLWPPLVPGAPTIGTATQTGSTTATVVFTAPVGNGGSVITSYTATSSPSGGTGTLSQAGSGTITVTGLTEGTSYTFTVTATNAIGTSAASAASNSITTPIAPPGVIGSAYQGGFYAGQIGVSGVATHYIVVGPLASAQNTSIKYKDANTAVAGADSVIDGPQNTADMVADGNATVYPAAHFCNDLVIGGYSDWYMPAKNELEICYFNLKPTTTNNNTGSGINPNAVPARASNYPMFGPPTQTAGVGFAGAGAEAFSAGATYYWSSSEFSAVIAWAQTFLDGTQDNGSGKTNNLRVRAIRRVPV